MTPTFLTLLVAALITHDDQFEGIDTDKIANWPKYTSESKDPDGKQHEDEDIASWLEDLGTEGEELDTENLEVVSITDDEMVLHCGGDWQPPATVTVKLVEGVLTVTEVKLFGTFEDGIRYEEILNHIADLQA